MKRNGLIIVPLACKDGFQRISEDFLLSNGNIITISLCRTESTQIKSTLKPHIQVLIALKVNFCDHMVCSSKAMMFVKLYFRTSDIYLISLVSLDPLGFHFRTKKMPSIEKKQKQYTTRTASVVVNISAS